MARKSKTYTEAEQLEAQRLATFLILKDLSDPQLPEGKGTLKQRVARDKQRIKEFYQQPPELEEQAKKEFQKLQEQVQAAHKDDVPPPPSPLPKEADQEGDSDWAAAAIAHAETPQDLYEALQVIRVDEDFAQDGFEPTGSHGGFVRYHLLMQEVMLRMRNKNPELPPVPTSENSVDYVNWCIEADRILEGPLPWARVVIAVALLVLVESFVAAGAWRWGEGENLLQKIVNCRWLFVVAFGAVFLASCFILGKKIWLRVKGILK